MERCSINGAATRFIRFTVVHKTCSDMSQVSCKTGQFKLRLLSSSIACSPSLLQHQHALSCAVKLAMNAMHLWLSHVMRRPRSSKGLGCNYLWTRTGKKQDRGSRGTNSEIFLTQMCQSQVFQKGRPFRYMFLKMGRKRGRGREGGRGGGREGRGGRGGRVGEGEREGGRGGREGERMNI